MIRAGLLLAALAVGACSCTTSPTHDAQARMDAIRRDYQAAHQVELRYADRPDCPGEQAPDELGCAKRSLVRAARRAGYDAESAIVVADGKRSEVTLERARRTVDVYVGVTWELQ